MSDQTPPPPPAGEPPYSGQPPQNPYGAPSSQGQYGAPQSAYAQPPYGQSPYGGGGPTQKPAVLSIISLVLGILGVVGFFVVFIPIAGSIMQLFIPAAAIVLGFLGKSREPWAPRGLWLTGIILGFVGIAIAILSLIAWIVLFASAGSIQTTY